MTVLIEDAVDIERPTGPIRVIVTPHLTDTPCLILRDGLPWTLIVLQQGARSGDAAPWFASLEQAERDAWFVPFGCPPGENVWDYVDPDMLLHPSQIQPEHRLPAHLESAFINDL